MSESALLMMQGDSALMTGSANSTLSGAGRGLAGDANADAQGFSRLLQTRMPGAEHSQKPGARPESMAGDTARIPGQATPHSGKTLPDGATDAEFTPLPLGEDGRPLSGQALMALIYGDELATPAAMEEGTPIDPMTGIESPAVNAMGMPLPGTEAKPQISLAQRENTAQGNSTHLPGQGLPANPMNTSLSGMPASGMPAGLVDAEGELPEIPPGMMNRPLSAGERMALADARTAQAAKISSSGQSDSNTGMTRSFLNAAMEMQRVDNGAMMDVSLKQARLQSAMESITSPTNSTLTPDSPEVNLNSLASGQRLASGASVLPTLNVSAPVGQQGWSNELGQRVSWMANTEVREAQIQLNPRHLGPVDIKMTMGPEQQVNVTFTATHQVTRDALDAAMPRLREMFEQQGMNLADANVADDSSARQQNAQGFDEQHLDGQRYDEAENGSALMDDPDSLPSLVTAEMRGPHGALHAAGSGMIDAYA